MNERILLADDDDALRRVLEFKLSKRGYAVTAVADGVAALAELHDGAFDLLLADIRMPRLSGIELLAALQGKSPQLRVILMTAHATVPQAVEAVKLGAFDYLTKPFDDDQLFLTIAKALEFVRLESENRRLKSELKRSGAIAEIIGDSTAMSDVIETIRKIAPSDATVLITGESGTGKELVARALHSLSQRSGAAMVTINAAAIPRELLEADLFGHVKGAFTGAIREKKGQFDLAAGGTVFLDEISDLPLELQPKILRVIQERVIQPVGSERVHEIDVRVIAATNADLKERVAQGRFREDLFYRLNVVPIMLPPLRARISDIPLLVRHFLDRQSAPGQVSITDELMAKLLDHDWPGNVRELENIVRRMALLRSSDSLTLANLPDDLKREIDTAPARHPAGSRSMTFHEAERRLIIDALQRAGGNRTRAAEILAIPRHVLIYRMKKYNIA